MKVLNVNKLLGHKTVAYLNNSSKSTINDESECLLRFHLVHNIIANLAEGVKEALSRS